MGKKFPRNLTGCNHIEKSSKITCLRAQLVGKVVKANQWRGLSSRPFLDARAVEAVVDAAEGLLLFLVVEQDVTVDAAKSVAPDETFAVGTTNETRLESGFRF